MQGSQSTSKTMTKWSTRDKLITIAVCVARKLAGILLGKESSVSATRGGSRLSGSHRLDVAGGQRRPLHISTKCDILRDGYIDAVAVDLLEWPVQYMPISGKMGGQARKLTPAHSRQYSDFGGVLPGYLQSRSIEQ